MDRRNRINNIEVFCSKHTSGHNEWINTEENRNLSDHIVREFLNILNDTDRFIFTMKQQQRTQKEIAKVLKISQPAVALRLKKIKKMYKNL